MKIRDIRPSTQIFYSVMDFFPLLLGKKPVCRLSIKQCLLQQKVFGKEEGEGGDFLIFIRQA